jgi:hypothetical protein
MNADPNAELKLALAAIRNTSTKTSDETAAKTSKMSENKTDEDAITKTSLSTRFDKLNQADSETAAKTYLAPDELMKEWFTTTDLKMDWKDIGKLECKNEAATTVKTSDIVNASASKSIEIANASDCKSMTPPSPPTPMHHKQLNLIKQCFATKYGDSGSDIVQDSKFAYACIPIATQVTTETNEIKNRAAAKTSTKKKKKGEGAILKRKMNREALFGMDDSNLHATKFEIGMQDASTQTWIGLE